MASAGTETVDATGKNVYEAAKQGSTAFFVKCTSGSASTALVHISGLHDDGDFFVLAAGEEQIFRLNHNGIRKVFVKGDGGSATIQYGVVAKTAPPY